MSGNNHETGRVLPRILVIHIYYLDKLMSIKIIMETESENHPVGDEDSKMQFQVHPAWAL